MKQAFLVFAIFLIFAASAMTGFPATVLDPDIVRGVRAIDWIMRTLFIGPFGKEGGAVALVAIGTVLSGVAYLRNRKGDAQPEADTPNAPGQPVRGRKRPGNVSEAKSLPQQQPTKGEIARLMGADFDSAAASDERFADKGDYGALITAIVEANAPPPPAEGPLSPELQVAIARPIVFRQFMPTGANDGLSFYGGLPFGPAAFEWPRSGGEAEGKPLHFIMQWDCAVLSRQDATGLLPADGVLYCFLDLEWGNGENGHRFFHHSGPTCGWETILPPDDLGPVFGDQGVWQMTGWHPKFDHAPEALPRLMPRFPFTPLAFDYPLPVQDPDEEEVERIFWSDGERTAQALLAVQQSVGGPAEVRDIQQKPAPFTRPFPAFPHDFGAVRVVAARALQELSHPDRGRLQRWFPDFDGEECDRQIAMWLDEAAELYRFAEGHDMGARVTVNAADDIWAWIAGLERVLKIRHEHWTVDAIDLSLGIASKGLCEVPASWIDRAADRHVLAHEYLRDEHLDHSQPDAWKRHEEKRAAGLLQKVRVIHAPTPSHMFGPASYVQGYVEELVDDHLLLLELTNGSGPGHHFGEGVLQYLIKPDDLRAGRFDKVRSVLSGY